MCLKLTRSGAPPGARRRSGLGRRLRRLAVCGLACLLAACAPLSLPGTPEQTPVLPTTSAPSASSSPTAPPTLDRSQVPAATPAVERVPATPAPVVGEVPQALLAKMLADVEQRALVSREAITIVRAEFVVWNDGSLGCAKPGEVYTQTLVDGYWVVLQVGAASYDYRAAAQGYFFLCEPHRP